MLQRLFHSAGPVMTNEVNQGKYRQTNGSKVCELTSDRSEQGSRDRHVHECHGTYEVIASLSALPEDMPQTACQCSR